MCFSLNWIEQLLVYVVVICAVFGIIKLLVPFVLTQLGAAGGVIAGVINIVLWAFICIVVIYFCFSLIACFAGGAPHLFPR